MLRVKDQGETKDEPRMNQRTPKLKKVLFLRLRPNKVVLIPKKVDSHPKKVDSVPEIVNSSVSK